MKKKSPARVTKALMKVPTKEETKLVPVAAPPVPKLVEKKPRKVTQADLVEVNETSLVLAIELKRQPDSIIFDAEIGEGQKFFPYAVLPRLLVGWQLVGYISSFEMKTTCDNPFPQIVIRFVENMTAEAIGKMEEGLKSQIMASINYVRQFPFVRVESPLLVTGG